MSATETELFVPPARSAFDDSYRQGWFCAPPSHSLLTTRNTGDRWREKPAWLTAPLTKFASAESEKKQKTSADSTKPSSCLGYYGPIRDGWKEGLRGVGGSGRKIRMHVRHKSDNFSGGRVVRPLRVFIDLLFLFLALIHWGGFGGNKRPSSCTFQDFAQTKISQQGKMKVAQGPKNLKKSKKALIDWSRSYQNIWRLTPLWKTNRKDSPHSYWSRNHIYLELDLCASPAQKFCFKFWLQILFVLATDSPKEPNYKKLDSYFGLNP